MWTLKYYKGHTPSWNWFYSAHYAPLISDLHECVIEVISLIRKSRQARAKNRSQESPSSTGKETDKGDTPTSLDEPILADEYISFEPSEPWPAIAQLVAVLPPESASLLPDWVRAIVCEGGELRALYPTPAEYEIDPDPKVTKQFDDRVLCGSFFSFSLDVFIFVTIVCRVENGGIRP